MTTSPQFTGLTLKIGLLAAVGLGAGLLAFALSKPTPVHLAAVIVDTLPTGIRSTTDPPALLQEVRGGLITIRKATAILALSVADSTDPTRVDSVRAAAEQARYTFRARLAPTLRVVDPALSLILTPKDAPFPRTLILIEPGRHPRILPLPTTLDSLRAVLDDYRGTRVSSVPASL